MKNQKLQQRISDELLDFLQQQRSLMLSTLDENGWPYASYAPFGMGDNCLYVLLSEIAIHAVNLQINSKAGVLIIEDEGTAGNLFARIRVNYQVEATHIAYDSNEWNQGLDILITRHGERIKSLSQLSDFKLFRLQPKHGRYVKNFGRAYSIQGDSLVGDDINHLRDGHKNRGDSGISEN